VPLLCDRGGRPAQALAASGLLAAVCRSAAGLRSDSEAAVALVVAWTDGRLVPTLRNTVRDGAALPPTPGGLSPTGRDAPASQPVDP
jgi:hypothetical protein